MSSRSSSRGRSPSRSHTPISPDRTRDVSRSPRRSISARMRSRSASLTPRRRRSPSRSSRSYSRSLTRSPSPSPPRSSKIVIEKLSKNVNEAHLAEIFGAYGTIQSLEVPMNRQFITNRGTAYIQFTSEDDAETAIAHMHEAQLDGGVISVSTVLPRSRRTPSPPRRPVESRRTRGWGPNSMGGGSVAGRRSPISGPGRPARRGRGGRNLDTYRPRSASRSRSPRRHRTRSRSDSRSRSPPRRGGGGRRRRSPSYSSYSSYDDKSRSISRSRSRSRDRGPRSRGR